MYHSISRWWLSFTRIARAGLCSAMLLCVLPAACSKKAPKKELTGCERYRKRAEECDFVVASKPHCEESKELADYKSEVWPEKIRCARGSGSCEKFLACNEAATERGYWAFIRRHWPGLSRIERLNFCKGERAWLYDLGEVKRPASIEQFCPPLLKAHYKKTEAKVKQFLQKSPRGETFDCKAFSQVAARLGRQQQARTLCDAVKLTNRLSEIAQNARSTSDERYVVYGMMSPSCLAKIPTITELKWPGPRALLKQHISWCLGPVATRALKVALKRFSCDRLRETSDQVAQGLKRHRRSDASLTALLKQAAAKCPPPPP